VVDLIYIVYGEDDFSKKQFLNGLVVELGHEDVRDANTTFLAGSGLTFNQLIEVGSVIPFLAEKRLIVVDSFFSQFEVSPRRAGARNRGDKYDALLAEWDGASEALKLIPDTTTIVFWEINLNLSNPIFQEIKKSAQVKQFLPLKVENLKRWINNRVLELGCKITPGATKELIEFIGPDLWMMENELRKLTLYAGTEYIDEEAISLLVPRLKEANIFKTVDAILEGRSLESIQSVRKLSEDGAHVSYILTMIARQLRLILLAKNLIKKNLRGSNLAQRLGLRSEFAVERTLAQARRYDSENLKLAYGKLLDADLAVKGSFLSDELVIETTIADMIQKGSQLKTKVSRTGSH